MYTPSFLFLTQSVNNTREREETTGVKNNVDSKASAHSSSLFLPHSGTPAD